MSAYTLYLSPVLSLDVAADDCMHAIPAAMRRAFSDRSQYTTEQYADKLSALTALKAIGDAPFSVKCVGAGLYRFTCRAALLECREDPYDLRILAVMPTADQAIAYVTPHLSI